VEPRPRRKAKATEVSMKWDLMYVNKRTELETVCEPTYSRTMAISSFGISLDSGILTRAVHGEDQPSMSEDIQ
jgi:hypothetical protein